MVYEENDKPTSNEQKDPKTVQEQVRGKLDLIKRSRTHRDDIARKYRWRELIEEYKGRWEMAYGWYDMTILPINLIFAYVKTELPSLYIRDPHIKVNPKNKTSINTAKVLEEVINYVWYNKKIKREIKKCIIDALLIGHSWMKQGYTGKFGTVEDSNGKYIEAVEDEDIFAYHINWRDITFSNDALDPPYDCKWISHAVWVDIDDAKKNPRYQNTDKLQEGVEYDDTTENYDNDKIVESRKGKVRLEEVWDLENRTVCTISDGVDDYIEQPKEWPLEMKGYPFSMLKFNFSNDMAYGLSDTGMFEPQVLELIKIRSQEVDHLKRFNRQLITTPNNISEDEMQKFTQGKTGSIINVDDPSKVLPVPYPPLQVDAYAIEERIKEDAINISGQSPQERGATQKTSTRSLGELRQMREGSVNRRSEKVDLVEDFVEEVSSKLIALLKQFATDPYYIRILGTQSEVLQQAIQERKSSTGEQSVTNQGGFTFTADDIEGEFDVEPVSGSSTPLDKGELMKTLLELLEIGPKAGAIPGGPYMGTVAKLINENLDIEELDVALQAEQQMQQQQKAEQAQKAEEMRTLALSQKAAEGQLDAENVATKQNKVLVEFLKVMKDASADEQRNAIDLLKAQQAKSSE